MSESKNTPAANLGVQGITEDDIANYLANTPGFFERHAELLSSIQLTNPHGQRAVSLQERQMQMLRERIKGLEFKLIEMIRNGQDNQGLIDRLHRLTLAALLTPNAAQLPGVIQDTLAEEFLIPHVALRLWGVDAPYAVEAFAQGVSAEARELAANLSQPYCGLNGGMTGILEPVSWLHDGAEGAAGRVASVALVPLRSHADSPQTLGLLVLGSPDPTRYSADMGTEFLVRLSEVVGAAVSRLQPRPSDEVPLPEIPPVE